MRQTRELTTMRNLLLAVVVSMATNACSEANEATKLTGTEESLSTDMLTTGEAAPDSAGIGAEEPGNVVEAQVLAELVVGEERISFLQLGSAADAPLALRVTGSAERGSVLDALYAREGELTQLEVFQALAPAGSIPPPAVAAAHADQVAALGRVDDEIRVVEKGIPRTPPPGVSACDVASMFGPPFLWSPLQVAAPFGNSYLCTGTPIEIGRTLPTASSCTHFTTKRQRVGACSISLPMSAALGAGSGVGWTVSDTTVFAPNQSFFWELPPSSTPVRAAVVGFASDDTIYGTRAGIGG
jgi:hypothetical protein